MPKGKVNQTPLGGKSLRAVGTSILCIPVLHRSTHPAFRGVGDHLPVGGVRAGTFSTNEEGTPGLMSLPHVLQRNFSGSQGTFTQQTGLRYPRDPQAYFDVVGEGCG